MLSQVCKPRYFVLVGSRSNGTIAHEHGGARHRSHRDRKEHNLMSFDTSPATLDAIRSFIESHTSRSEMIMLTGTDEIFRRNVQPQNCGKSWTR